MSWVHHWVWCVPVLVFLVFVTRLHEYDTYVWLTITAVVVLAVRLIRRTAAYSGA